MLRLTRGAAETETAHDKVRGEKAKVEKMVDAQTKLLRRLGAFRTGDRNGKGMVYTGPASGSPAPHGLNGAGAPTGAFRWTPCNPAICSSAKGWGTWDVRGGPSIETMTEHLPGLRLVSTLDGAVDHLEGQFVARRLGLAAFPDLLLEGQEGLGEGKAERVQQLSRNLDVVQAQGIRRDRAFGAAGHVGELAHGLARRGLEGFGVDVVAEAADGDQSVVDVPQDQGLPGAHRTSLASIV
ncbi:hypothetical protein AB0K05_23865 [Nonomuraea sp. NPDC049486]|uniref:hypothetical protein n=1 Tax=Nonomuraea sp. NPDC049486 TaxID=3155773 RepID=UPI00342F0F54